MAAHDIVILNQNTNELQEVQVGDEAQLTGNFNVTGNIVVSGTVDGRDLSADGAVTDLALITGDNLSELTNDIIASQAEAEAGTDNTKLITPLRCAEAIASLAAGKKTNAVGANPGVTNDDSEGYATFSLWRNTSNDKLFMCADPTTNVAVWLQISGDTTESITTGITAYGGGGQANATELSAGINRVDTVATLHDSCKLPAAVPGTEVICVNESVLQLELFPAAANEIDANGSNIAIAVTVGSNVTLKAISATKWVTV